jgi:FkbM family methyltransferase
LENLNKNMNMKRLFDIGANRGLYADANENKYDEIILVEANPKMCDFLSKKYEGKSKFKVVNVIVSSKEETPFYVCENADTISTADEEWIHQSRFSKDYNWQRISNVESKSVDNLIKQFGSPTFMKIDVEGYEYNVITSVSSKISPLCFEWAEEKKVEILLTLEYLHKIGYDKFALQMRDDYTYVVNEDDWITFDSIYTNMSELCDPNKKSMWGMIWAT